MFKFLIMDRTRAWTRVLALQNNYEKIYENVWSDLHLIS